MSTREPAGPQRAEAWIWALLILAYVAQVASHRFMFADGSHFLADILARHDFARWDWPRQFAHYVTQAPVVLAISLGMRDLTLLSLIYGGTLFAVPLASLALCAWLVPTPQRAYLLLPLFAWAYMELNSGLFIISESHLAAACFFVLLFYAEFVDLQRGGWGQSLLVTLVALASVRVYESFLFLGPPLVALAWMRLRGHSAQVSTPVKVAFGALATSGLAAAAIGFYWMIFSERNVHSVGLGQMVLQLATCPNVVVSSLLFAWVLGALARPGAAGVRPTAKRLFVAGAVGFLAGLLPLASAVFMPASLHYAARLLTIFVPLLLGAGMVWWRRQPLPLAPSAMAPLLLPLCMMLAWNFSWQVTACEMWRRYTRAFVQAAHDSRGVASVADTALADNLFNVPWTLPTLSILLPALEGEPVGALIEGETPWQPFDPRRGDQLPRLGDYGVTYTPALLHPAPR